MRDLIFAHDALHDCVFIVDLEVNISILVSQVGELRQDDPLVHAIVDERGDHHRCIVVHLDDCSGGFGVSEARRLAVVEVERVGNILGRMVTVASARRQLFRVVWRRTGPTMATMAAPACVRITAPRAVTATAGGVLTLTVTPA